MLPTVCGVERVPSPTEVDGRLPRTVVGFETGSQASPELAPEGTPLWKNRSGELAPRAGVAYQLPSKTGWESTLRSGVGVFHDLGLGDVASAFQTVYPFYAETVACCSVHFPLSNDVRQAPALGQGPPTFLWVFDRDLRLPHTTQWNVAWEQTIARSQTLTTTYVGATGRRQLLSQNINETLLNWPEATVPLNWQRLLGRSSYKSLQVQYQRRLSRGVQALASYTLASSRDNASYATAFVPPADFGDLLAKGTHRRVASMTRRWRLRAKLRDKQSVAWSAYRRGGRCESRFSN